MAAFCITNELLQFTEFIASQAGPLHKMRDQRNNGTLSHSIHKVVQLSFSDSIRLYKRRVVRRLFTSLGFLGPAFLNQSIEASLYRRISEITTKSIMNFRQR